MMSEELKKIFRDLDKLEAEKETWKEMYEMQSKLVLNLELNKIEMQKEIADLKEKSDYWKNSYCKTFKSTDSLYKENQELKLDVQILTKALEESQLKYKDVQENIIKKVLAYNLLGMSYPLSVFDIPHEVEKLNEKSKNASELYQKELKEQIKGLKSCVEKCWNSFGESKFKIWDFVDGLELLVEKVQDVVEDKRMYEKIVDKTYDILAGDPHVDLPKGIFSIPELVEKMFGELKDLVVENKRLEDKLERYRQENKTLQSYVDNIYENLKQMTGEK